MGLGCKIRVSKLQILSDFLDIKKPYFCLQTEHFEIENNIVSKILDQPSYHVLPLAVSN